MQRAQLLAQNLANARDNLITTVVRIPGRLIDNLGMPHKYCVADHGR